MFKARLMGVRVLEARIEGYRIYRSPIKLPL